MIIIVRMRSAIELSKHKKTFATLIIMIIIIRMRSAIELNKVSRWE